MKTLFRIYNYLAWYVIKNQYIIFDSIGGLLSVLLRLIT